MKKLKIDKDETPSDEVMRTLWLHRYGSMEKHLKLLTTENKRLKQYESEVTSCGHVYFRRCTLCNRVRCANCWIGCDVNPPHQCYTTCLECESIPNRAISLDVVKHSDSEGNDIIHHNKKKF